MRLTLTKGEVLSLRRYTVIYPPTVSWNEPIYQRPHQLMAEFARQGHLAIFVNKIPDGNGIDWFASENLCISNDLLSTLSDSRIRDMIQGTRVVLWVTYAKTMAFQSIINPQLCIFDYIDEGVEEFAEWQKDIENGLASGDVIFTTSRNLFEVTQTKYPNRTYLLPNGADIYQFTKDVPIASDLENLRRNYEHIIGFHGTLVSWVDFSLIREIALNCPNWGIVLIGPDCGLPDACKNTANIHYLGSRPYSELVSYVRYFDVGIIPFEVRQVTHSANPIKMYEYLAAGVPLVATPIRECVNLSPVVRIAKDHSEFITQIKAALRAKKQEQALYLKIAYENSWAQRVHHALEVLEEF